MDETGSRSDEFVGGVSDCGASDHDARCRIDGHDHEAVGELVSAPAGDAAVVPYAAQKTVVLRRRQPDVRSGGSVKVALGIAGSVTVHSDSRMAPAGIDASRFAP